MPETWTLVRNGSDFNIYDQDARAVLWGKCDPDSDAEENLKHLVHAVNAHAELLAACKRLLAYVDCVEFEALKLKGAAAAVREAKAIIARAEEPHA